MKSEGQAWIVIGLAFGDEGKGSMVDHLVRRIGAGLVVRFNGGPQAAHHVVTPEGQVHCFAQLGSGSFAPGVETFLSAPMFVEPLALERELQALEGKGLGDIRARLWVDPDCPLVTPYHAWLNQLRELSRGASVHGTCGRGVGEAFADVQGDRALRVADLLDPKGLAARLARHRDAKLTEMERIRAECADQEPARRVFEEAATPELPAYLLAAYGHFAARSGVRFCGPELIEKRLRQGERLVFEGAQGVLLDQRHGFWPHVTPSDTTAVAARALLKAVGHAAEPLTLGVLRAYATRHGAGPLPTEDSRLTTRLPEPHNPNGGWQGAMRCGWFDAAAARYALAADGAVNRVAVTCVDRLARLPRWRFGVGYLDQGTPWAPGLGDDPLERTRRMRQVRPVFLELENPGHPSAEAALAIMEEQLGRPVDVASYGPSRLHKRWRG